MTLRIVCAFLVALGLLVPGEGSVAQAEDAAYFAGIEDLPIMPGLSEVEEAGVVFDKPEGRIVEAYATGQVGEGEVLEFYARTLPQLGWQSQSDRSYRREGETLTLMLESGSDAVLVVFRLEPH